MSKKIMTEEIASKINSVLLVALKPIKNLCQGGCGVFAVLLAEQLKKVGYDAKIIAVTLTKPDFWGCMTGIDFDFYKQHFSSFNKEICKDHKNNLPPSSDNLQPATHYIVQVNDFYFDSEWQGKADSDGILNMPHTEPFNGMSIIGEVSLSDMEYISIEKRGDIWNDQYDAHQNNKLKEILSTSLSNI